MNKKTYHIEVINITQKDIVFKRLTNCTHNFVVSIFLIPGIETPFKNLGLRHDTAWPN
jgi:hypothetical protein